MRNQLNQLNLWSLVALALTCECQSVRAGGDNKVHEVGKTGLTLDGKVAADDPNVKVIVGDKFFQRPAKLFLLKLSAGKKYRISMNSTELDSVLVVQNQTGQQLAWDDDSGGDLNSLLTLEILQDGTYKVFAVSLKGSGNFRLNVQEDGAIKVYEIGAALKLTGELGKTQAITYNVKLAAGTTYVIDMTSPNPEVLDPYLRMLDAEGKQLAEDDDGGGALNARIIHKVERAGTYQVIATCFGNGRGSFTLTVRDAREGERALTKEEQEKLSKARQINAKAIALHRAGKTADALKPTQEALALITEVLGEKHPDHATSVGNLGVLYHSLGNYAKAELLCRQALEIRKDVLGEKHPHVAESLNNLARLYEAQGNYAKAESLYRQALEVRKEVLGEKHADHATSLHNLAVLYHAQRNYKKAEPLYRQALEIRKEVLGEKHPDYATIVGNLGVLYHAQGTYAKAELLCRQALEIRKEVLGEKHPDYAQSLNDLAVLYDAQRNYAKAEPLYRQALEIRKQVLGEKHPDYAASLHILAVLYHSQGPYAKAELLCRQALEIRKEVLGEKHPDYAQSLNDLAIIYDKQRNYAKAEPLYRQALEIRKEVQGEKHPDYATIVGNLGVLYHSQGNYAKAELLCRQALEIRKEVLGEKHPDYAQSLNNLAVMYDKKRNYAKAEPLYRQVLEIRKEVLGEKHPDYAQSLNNLARPYEAQGNYAKAEPLCRLAMEIRKDVLGEKHPAYAESLNNLAVLYHAQRNYAKAEPLCRLAMEIRKDVLGEKHPAYAESLNNLASLYQSQGNYAKAEPLYRQALEIKKEVLGEKHPDYATSLNNLAGLVRHVNFAKAEPLYRQGLEIRKETLGEKHPDYATCLNNLASFYQSQGNYAKAAPLYRQALEIKKEVLGEKHPDYATCLNGLANLYMDQGAYAKADPLCRLALEICKEVLGEKHPDYAQSLNGLAALYHEQQNNAKAEPLFRQALDIRKEVLGEKHPDFAQSLHNLAHLYNSQENYAKAEPLYRQALEILKDVLGEKHPGYGTSLNNLAGVYHEQGNYTKAEPLYRQALEINKETLGEKHPDYSRSLNNLAALYHALGNYAKAEPLYRQVLEIRKEVMGEKHPEYARSLNNLASLYKSQGDFAQAEPLYRQAILATLVTKAPIAIEDVQPDHLRFHPDTVLILANHAFLVHEATKKGSTSKERRSCDRSYFLALTILDRVREEYRDSQESKTWLSAGKFDLFPGRISILQQLFSLEQKVQDIEAAFWTAEQGSARTFLEALGKNRVNLLAGVSPALLTEESRLLHDIRRLDLRIDKESAQALDQRNPDLIGESLVQRKGAEANLRELIARIETQHPQYAGLKYPRPCKLDEARASLSPDEVALLFVPGRDESFFVLVEARPKPGDKANGLAIIELPGAAALAEHVASLTDTETLGLPARARLLGRQAFDAILGPCKDRIKDKSLVIVPNGSLCFLPFELLVEKDGKYLVEKHRIRYAPSLTALHLINLWKQKRLEPEVPLFAVGDPLYEIGEKVAASGDSDALRELLWREGKPGAFKRLVHSSKEIAEIAKVLGAKSEYLLTGEDASEAKVKAASTAEKMAKARYVHFATHGILGVDKGKQPALVLNLVGNSGEDGFLEYEEILNLKLNADLVVLSACRTGQGRMARGEGVTGLARAFLYAGSKGVVCSLWSVDDRETANLMVDFYGHLQKGRPAAEALREAQLRMIRDGKAPLYWAPFILIGE